MWSFFVSKIVFLADDFFVQFWDTVVSEREHMKKKSNYKILIADDNPMARKGLSALLNSFNRRQENGIKVEIIGEAENGQEAITLAHDLVPDLIFMDINMPIMDGLKATKMIKDKLRNTKVVVLTMHADQQDAALQCGADGFIEKGSGAQKIKQYLSRFMMDK